MWTCGRKKVIVVCFFVKRKHGGLATVVSVVNDECGVGKRGCLFFVANMGKKRGNIEKTNSDINS